MKRAMLIAAMLTWCTILGAQPRIEFDKSAFDFGSIAPDNGKVSHSFRFRNTGDKPLVIIKSETFCTCTKAEYPKKPVNAGEYGEITVTYDPKKQAGTFHKAINIYLNTPEKREIITIKGSVQ